MREGDQVKVKDDKIESLPSVGIDQDLTGIEGTVSRVWATGYISVDFNDPILGYLRYDVPKEWLIKTQQQ